MLKPVHYASTALLFAAVAAPAMALDEIVTPQVFALDSYTTVGGDTLTDVRISWEAYGTLNAAKDNVILIAPYFSGTPHAAGKYAADDAQAGYWDVIIGSGLAIDTDKYYVLSADALCDIQAKLPTVETTGPASTDPATGAPYGADFPVLNIRDFVNVQKALVDSMGIERLHAVMGFSMGAAQTMQWAASYPDMVARALPVTPWVNGNGWVIATMYTWAAPIRRDPDWNGGNYYGVSDPIDGLAEAYEVVFMDALAAGFLSETFGRNWAAEGQDPAAAMDNLYAAETWLRDTSRAYAQTGDANAYLCQAKAIQLFQAGGTADVEAALAKISADVLLLPATADILFPPSDSAEFQGIIEAQGGSATYVEITGNAGHLNGSWAIAGVADAIAAFLAE